MTDDDTSAQLPRYVRRYLLPNGKYQYRYSPPVELIEAGVVKRQQLGTHKTSMIAKAKRLNAVVDSFRSGKMEGLIPKSNSKLDRLATYYYTTLKFLTLRTSTQGRYEAQIRMALDTRVEGKRLGDVKVAELNVRQCAVAYEAWAKESIANANDRRTIFGVLLNFAISMDLTQRNPMRFVHPKTAQKRTVRWEKHHVKAFLEAAYSDHATRNIGVILHMAYEWCQRIGDMRVLKWSEVDLANRRVTIRQSKRGAIVYLPIYDSLATMLQQQYEDYGFQEYVAPQLRAADKTWQPYTQAQVSTIVNIIKKKAEVPDELQARDLRRTGVTELIIAGVDMLGIMQVTGHVNVASIKPYQVNTLQGATNALDRRFAVGEEKLNES